MLPNFSYKTLLFCFSLFVTNNLISQKTFYGETPVKWENYEKAGISEGADLYAASDLVIINDETEFAFYKT